ncbi:MAG TPA: enoyl-CoA hydratase-related protein [Streptosporangiaceae bacterium]|nr:enoyl-CoA hydratase-related protein [Streptosporangiaceae bacterium]
MTDSVRWDLDGAVATITLNRPQARNALTAELKTALLGALRQAASSPQVRAVLITGAGQAFCAGQDLREHAGLLEAAGQDGADGQDEAAPAAGAPPSGAPAARTPAGSASAVGPPPAGAQPATAPAPLDTVREHYNPLVLAIRSMPKPVVAAVNGVAAGAGAGLAFACDLRIAAQGASFLMAFARVGLAADTGVSWTLPRLAGAGRAAELLMLAEPIRAPRAFELGLVNQVVEDAGLPSVAAALAARLAAGPTAAYAGIKEQLNYAAGHDLAEALDKEAEVQTALGRTADHRAATMAFTRKQEPRFLGR